MIRMSKPRAIKPNAYHFVSRRCTQGLPLLGPNKAINDIVLYCLEYSARIHDVGVVAFTLMSNRYWAVFHDRKGNLPDFLQYFHRLVALAVNCYHRRRENLWASGQTYMVECATSEDVLKKVIAVLTLPVTSHLVERVTDWPGASSCNAHLQNETLTFARPKYYFAKNGLTPEHVTLEIVRPPGYEHLTEQEFDALRNGLIENVEREVAAERAALASKTTRMTVQSPPSTNEPSHTSNTDGKCAPLSIWRPPEEPPSICTTNAEFKLLGIWKHIEVCVREKLFRKRYAQALARLKKGVRDVLFPAGTFQLRVRKLVNCEPFPNSS